MEYLTSFHSAGDSHYLRTGKGFYSDKAIGFLAQAKWLSQAVALGKLPASIPGMEIALRVIFKNYLNALTAIPYIPLVLLVILVALHRMVKKVSEHRLSKG